MLLDEVALYSGRLVGQLPMCRHEPTIGLCAAILASRYGSASLWRKSLYFTFDACYKSSITREPAL